jgi:hypothetical protein
MMIATLGEDMLGVEDNDEREMKLVFVSKSEYGLA